MPDLLPWLIGLALVALVAFLYWAERRYPASSGPVRFGAKRCDVREVRR